jgi:hypothetical protein
MLFELMCKADAQNKLKLFRAFPHHGKAFTIWDTSPNENRILDQLENKFGGDLRSDGKEEGRQIDRQEFIDRYVPYNERLRFFMDYDYGRYRGKRDKKQNLE